MRDTRGITLIELVIAISILGLVMVSINQVLDSWSDELGTGRC